LPLQAAGARPAKKVRPGLRSGEAASGDKQQQPRPPLSISQKAFNYLWRRKQWGGGGAQPLPAAAGASSLSPCKLLVRPIAPQHQPINNTHAPAPLKHLPKGGAMARGLAQLREELAQQQQAEGKEPTWLHGNGELAAAATALVAAL